MKSIITMTVCAALLASPGLAMAQSATDAPVSGAMKGPPNANGAASGQTLQSDQTSSGRSDSAGQRMNGTPNANGAPGAKGAGNPQ
jgi:hypothetical protein